MGTRERSANFNVKEVELLIDIASKYNKIIQNKQTDSSAWEQKNRAWEKITEEFNEIAENDSARSVKTLRTKYTSLKKLLKKKCDLIKSAKENGIQVPSNLKLARYEKKFISMHNMNPDISSNSEVFEFVESEINDKEILDDKNSLLEGDEILNDDLSMSSNSDRELHPDEDIQSSSSGFPSELKEETNSTINEPKKQKGKKSDKSNFKLNEDEMETAKESLMKMQKKFIAQEIKQRAQIHQLAVENMKLEIEIKKTQLYKLRKSLKKR